MKPFARLTACLLGAVALATTPAHALPVVEEMWVLAYCSLNPDSILPCLQRGVPMLFLNVQVEHVAGQQVYEFTDAQLLTLGLPLPGTGLLFDYCQAPGCHFLYSNDRDFWDGVPLPFVALPAPHVAWTLGPGVDAGPMAHTPEPGTIFMVGAALTWVGWRVRRRRG